MNEISMLQYLAIFENLHNYLSFKLYNEFEGLELKLKFSLIVDLE
jgi:hypothetical protein